MKKHTNTIVFTFIILITISAGVYLYLKPPASAMELTAKAIAKTQLESGFFTYEYNLRLDTTSSENNIVRQAGAGYGLSEYYLYTGDNSVKKSIVKAIEAYRDETFDFQEGRVIAKGGSMVEAPSGATALALLTELQYFEATGDNQFEEIREDWVNGIYEFWAGDVFDFDISGYRSGFSKLPGSFSQSDYYNGEIWLALAYYQSLFPNNEKVNEMLERTDDDFLTKYGENPTIEFYHWGAMAAKKRYETTKDERFANYAVDSTLNYITALKPRHNTRVNSCYAVEGMISSYAVFDGATERDPLTQDLIKNRINEEHSRNLEFQVLRDMSPYSLKSENRIPYENRRMYEGLFINGFDQPLSRIDFSQHCLSSLVKYDKYLSEENVSN